MDEIERLRENALKVAAIKCDLSINHQGDLILRPVACVPAYTVNLTQAILELVDARIAKALHHREALAALDEARGGH